MKNEDNSIINSVKRLQHLGDGAFLLLGVLGAAADAVKRLQRLGDGASELNTKISAACGNVAYLIVSAMLRSGVDRVIARSGTEYALDGDDALVIIEFNEDGSWAKAHEPAVDGWFDAAPVFARDLADGLLDRVSDAVDTALSDREVALRRLEESSPA